MIGGPTASGKSAQALRLADAHDGVIINADSLQIYDGLPILTAQPPAEDLTQAPHKLYGHFHPNAPCSAGNWCEIVKPLIEDVLSQNKAPVIVGGSGLYINSLLYGLSPMPDVPSNVREATNKLHAKLGNAGFYEALEKRDPIMAARFHPDHTARLIRAYEVIEATGKSLAQWQELPRLAPPESWQFDVTLVMPERATLYERCNMRFEWMLDNNVLEEIKAFNALKKSGEILDTVPINNALGLKPLTAYINGDISKEEAVTLGQAETRRYAKRQTTWFNHQIKENKNVANISTIT